MMVQFPAAISCASLIASETKAKMTATMKEVMAVRYSILRCFDIVVTYDYMNGGSNSVLPPPLNQIDFSSLLSMNYIRVANSVHINSIVA